MIVKWRPILAAGLAAAVFVASVSVADSAGPAQGPVLMKRAAASSAPKPQSVTRLIVKFRDVATDASAQSTRAARIQRFETSERVTHVRDMAGNAALLRLNAAKTLADARDVAARIAQDPGVEYVVPDILMKRVFAPSDTHFTDWQWNLSQPSAPFTSAGIANDVSKTALATGGANLPPAWDVAPAGGSSSLVVAVIDTGIVNHIDLNGRSSLTAYVPGGRFLQGYDFISSNVGEMPANFVANDGDGRDPDPSDPGDWVTAAEKALYPASCDDGAPGPTESSWHGTHMAGSLGAIADNANGIAGIAFNVQVLPIRALGKCGGSLSDIAEAIRWAAGLPVPNVPNNPTPAKVISLSLGGGDCTNNLQFMQDAVTAATGAGAVVVAATGNDGSIDNLIAPANCTGAIAVTAHTINGDNADYANIGQGTSISAPGGGSPTLLGAGGATDDPNWNGFYIWSTVLYGATTPASIDSKNRIGEGFAGFTGTSSATPQVAGVAALLKSAQPNAAAAFIKSWLTMASSVRPHPVNGYCSIHAQECGHGLLDAELALKAARDAVPAVSVSASTRVVPPGGTINFTGSVTPYTNRTIPNAALWTNTAGTLNSTTGNAVTLIAPTTGSATVTLTATDSAGATAFDSVTVRVNRPPVLNAIPNQSGTVGQTITFTVTGTDPDGDPLRFSASTLPADALFSPAGQFSWNTAKASPGTYSLVYTASDPFTSTAASTVTITLAPGAGGGAPPPTGGGGGGGALPVGQLLLLAALLLATRIRRRE